MKCIPISIIRISSTDFPGWVDAQMIDADGIQHHFEEKIPVISTDNHRVDTIYPRQGFIACEVISTWMADDGQTLSKVDTSKPWGVASKTGATQFVVLSDYIQSIT